MVSLRDVTPIIAQSIILKSLMCVCMLSRPGRGSWGGPGGGSGGSRGGPTGSGGEGSRGVRRKGPMGRVRSERWVSAALSSLWTYPDLYCLLSHVLRTCVDCLHSFIC